MKYLTWAVLVLVLIFAVRELFPKRIERLTPPRIITVYDTVRALDTAWVRRVVKQTDTLYLERVTLTLPETVYVIPRLNGLTALAVGKPGDSTLARGFTLMPSDSGSGLLIGWQAQWWTPGPLRGFSLDTFPPRLSFYDPPGKSCGLFCKVKHYAIGAAGGWAVCKL